MSYSGYEVIMCKNGHHECVDSFDYITDSVCEYCGELSRSVGSVDCTNGSPYFLDFELHQKTPDVQVHCPVCGKVHKRTEGTYEFKKVEMYESEKDDYIKTTMDTVHNVSEEACSEFCDLHRKMKNELMDLWNDYVEEEASKVTESGKAITKLMKERFPYIGEMFTGSATEHPRGQTPNDPHWDDFAFYKTKRDLVIDKCCNKGYVMQDVLVRGTESISVPHCKECGKLITINNEN